MKISVALASVLAAVALGCGDLARSEPAKAASRPPTGRQCFYAPNVNGFRAVDDRVVNLRVGVREVWRFEMFGPCPDLDWSERIALVSRGASWICSGLDAELVTPSPIGPQRCPVGNIRKLTPAEVAALPKRARP